jgi:hypothetical protein
MQPIQKHNKNNKEKNILLSSCVNHFAFILATNQNII